MKRDRYDTRDRNAYDGRPVKTRALSPRNAPSRLTAGGKAGRATSGQPADPTAGRNGAGGRRPRGNTMRNARMGGAGITYFEPAELARETLTYPSAPAAPHLAFTARRKTRNDTLAAAEFEGIRQRVMTDHSILRTTGAMRVTFELRRFTDDYGDSRCVPVAVPHWAGCNCEICQPPAGN